MMPKVVVVVLNWNGKQFLKECLDSLLRQTYRNYQVFFVDNGSYDGSVEYVKTGFRSKKLDILPLEKNFGFAEGNNIGIRKALKDSSVRYVIIINNDTIVDKRFIEEYVRGAERYPHAGSFACRIVVHTNPGVMDNSGIMLYKNGMPSGRGIGEPVKNYAAEDEVFGASGTAAMYSCRMLRDVAPDGNYYDSEFFIYQEEFDLSWRAQLRGWKCYYIPKAYVRHIGSGVMRKFSKRVKYLLERNKFWAMSKNMNRSVFFYSLPHILLYEITSLPFYLIGGYLPSVLRGRIEGIMKMRKFARKGVFPVVTDLERIKWMSDRDYIRIFRLNVLGRS